jgi:hypothetical protein
MSDLLKQAIVKLEKATNFTITHTPEYGVVDGTLTIEYAGQKYTWQIETINRLTRPLLAKILRNTLFKDDCLLIAPYINENLAQLCRAEAINFIDLAGNMYLYRPPMFINIQGHKPAPEHKALVARQQTGKAFQPKGMKLVMMLLLDAELVNQPMRVIAEQAEVALGTVKQVLDDLKHLSFIIEKGQKGKVLAEQDLLLTRWLDAYPRNMEAKLEQSLYTTDNIETLKQAKLEQYGALWGGEVAAEAYTHYLKPSTYLIYADSNTQTTLLKTFRLRRLRSDENAENAIRLVVPPVSIDKLKGPRTGLVAPLLVYAELLNSNDSRNLETAKRLYNDYLT